MKLATISFTERSSKLNCLVSQALSQKGYDCDSYSTYNYANRYELKNLECSLEEWTGHMFEDKDGILFISSVERTVRITAPFTKGKTKDPAIVVMDEKGIFAIPLMSGRLGWADELTGILANLTGAIPVITTPADVNGRFAVEVFAKKNGMHISDMEYAKSILLDTLDEKQIGFYTDFPITGVIPEEISLWTPDKVFEGTNGICVSLGESKAHFKQTLYLIPKIVSIGIECKTGTAPDVIESRILEELEAAQVSAYAVKQIASIDRNADEAGILGFAEKHAVPFYTYSPEELRKAESAFTERKSVYPATDASDICRRSALLVSDNGRLIWSRSLKSDVAIALAVEEYDISFE